MRAGFFYGPIRLVQIQRMQRLHRDTIVVEVEEEGDTRVCQVRREILARRDRIIRVVVVAVAVMMVSKNVNVMSMLFCKREKNFSKIFLMNILIRCFFKVYC